ncbi:SWI/SNF-related matrix-associated actin-dependent regulator of chromatin subfamily A containing DEAD/H box 1-like [Limulus polyphemus]|uniref:SWI/SNF-related matrix-associated actin-dependent regulator of chromatin subfamily A containing DEAD/H box 1-like n=1 Tax=Limulus polyphemus TaxID=6850 RepID=A0ABM1SXI1_LIMPO|nr:SWI/SNF-related matrix-associated actin-dependent regulator of chromatin subfamily A containing DEAD/H box 1-like [Limulus polyphemus]XP_022248337.1 SWI/SNF-related matrix-associated actin-dependent regulator of chromatin subfamily A containing DEAD/H box 1-like [Limulus polyphemus]
MELQDILVTCGWNVKKALCELTGDKHTQNESSQNAEDVSGSAMNRTLSEMKKTNHTVNNKQTLNIPSSRQKLRRIVYNDSDEEDKCLTKLHLTTSTKSYSKIKHRPCRGQFVQKPLQDFLKALKTQATSAAPEPTVNKKSCLTISSNSEKYKLKEGIEKGSEDHLQLPKNPEIVKKINLHELRKQKLLDSASSVNNHVDEGETTSDERNRRNMGKASKAKKRQDIGNVSDEEEDDYKNEDVYNSEASDDDDGGNGTLTPSRANVLAFFQTATVEELITVPSCSKKKVDSILSCRPFSGWQDLVKKFEQCKHLTPDLLNGAQNVINMRAAIIKLMQCCQRISDDMEKIVGQLLRGDGTDIEGYITQQPASLTKKLHLAPYQILGLNWLVLMHRQELNGILGDEMGLGKTVQAISFLTHLKETGEDGPHLIVVPSSTLDNWQREFLTWSPTLNVLCYHGSQDERRELRLQIANDEVEDFHILITTYNMITSSAEDRAMFKKMEFYYVIFDEAHMLKNMRSQRYQHLMRVKAKRRLLLTGTPLQNNLIELMSLLIFVMPNMFDGKIDQVKQMFTAVCKSEENRGKFERERIDHAKRMLKPFLLRRLKSEVLQQLPTKHEEIIYRPLSDVQKDHYNRLVARLSKEVQEGRDGNRDNVNKSNAGMMMQLRKAANHPLLFRNHYTDEIIRKMAREIMKEPTHREANEDRVVEDMQVMSDFELHTLCKLYKMLSSFKLNPDIICDSGKLKLLDSLLPELQEKGSRVLIFSQFTMILDILQEYLKIRNYKHLRMDGSSPVLERQELIDQFNDDPDIFIFLLSTRAGGLGINLTAANVVLLHDIDFNPYNDKQAEDRCHRVGQEKEVRVIRMISKDTIEEGILSCAHEKLKLEKDITATDDAAEQEDTHNLASLLKNALGL